MGFAATASADVVTAAWNANPESDITSYLVSYGTTTGVHATTIEAGNVLTRQVTLPPGFIYFFVVQARNAAGLSLKSTEVSINLLAANGAPVLNAPATQTSGANASVSLQLVASDPNGNPLTYSAAGLPPSLTVNSTTGLISGTLSSASVGTHAVTATVSDGLLSASRSFSWIVTSQAPSATRTLGRTDFDGDGRMDITVFRPSNATWYILKSSTNFASWSIVQWGTIGDVPVPGDYDGDARTDIAVYRPSNATWYILKSTTNFTTWSIIQWGTVGDVAVPADYDGDARTDIAVYRPSNATWYVLKSSTNNATWAINQWGIVGDIAVPGDYDGDGKADLTVYRPSNATWSVLKSSTNNTTWIINQWGTVGDVAVPEDFDGDGKTDIAVYRPASGTWYILQSRSNFTTWSVYQFGGASDIPVAGDYDDDGRADVAFYRPSNGTRNILKSSTNSTTSDTYAWGVAGDIP